jgi:hypothetical protein
VKSSNATKSASMPVPSKTFETRSNPSLWLTSILVAVCGNAANQVCSPIEHTFVYQELLCRSFSMSTNTSARRSGRFESVNPDRVQVVLSSNQTLNSRSLLSTIAWQS